MNKFLSLLTFLIMSASLAEAQSGAEKAAAVASVEKAVELFRKTMVDPDEQVFNGLISEHLSYGHSLGLIEDKKTCIESMVTGKFNFDSIELSEQTVKVVGETAIVRHTFFAHTHDAGKDPGTVKLKVLQVWHQEKGKWLLLARQAVRI